MSQVFVPMTDFTSSYMDLLTKMSMQPVFQSVLHRRIELAQKYSKGRRYLPPYCIEAFGAHSNRPHRFQHYAIAPMQQTGIRYRDSALELSSQVWNRVPQNIVGKNENGIKERILDASYRDAVWELTGDMEACILQL